MVRLCGGPDQLKKTNDGFMIPPEKQNQAIREEAGRFLKNLRGAPKLGDQLVSIVEAFGNVAVSQLKYLNSKNEAGLPPKQANRIEPYEPFSLSNKAQELYDDCFDTQCLLRIIEEEAGGVISSHGCI